MAYVAHRWVVTVRRGSALVGAVLVLMTAGAAGVRAESSGPRPSAPAPAAVPSADDEYNRGLRLRASKDWAGAVSAFRRATGQRRAFPEAWNELGYALCQQGKYDESVAAYDEALRQRPGYPEALEYLGEAYVKMQRLDDARRVLDRLRPIDAGRAKELAEVIERGR